MCRIPLQTVETAPDDAKSRLEAGEKANGFLPNLLRVLANAPAALEAYLTLGQINAKASLTLAEREVVQLTAAATHGCGFCVAGHTAIALNKAKLAAAEVEALRAVVRPADPKHAAVQAFTKAVIRVRGAVSNDELAAFKAAGYSDAAALEVVLGVGLATICNFANNLGQPELNAQLETYRWQPPQARAAQYMNPTVPDWFDVEADTLDTAATRAADVLPALVDAGLTGTGVAQELGGSGGDAADAVEAIAAVSARSLASGFVLWGHRTFIEYLLQTDNTALRDRLLPGLLAGEAAGATGLSNAMKFLSGLEGLQIDATPDRDGFRLSGKLPWVTNLRPPRFWVAAAVTRTATAAALVVAIPSDIPGVARSADLDLMAMRASNTAAIDLKDAWVGDDCLLADEAQTWLPRVRPAFLGMQCGLSIGLARRGLDEARRDLGQGRHILRVPIEALAAELARLVAEMHEGLRAKTYIATAARLFELRIRLAEIAQEAVSLELQASGGRAYLSKPGHGFQRRWREAAFVPIITPSLVQLRGALAAHTGEHAA